MAFQYWQQKGPQWSARPDSSCSPRRSTGDTLGAVSVGGIDLFHSTPSLHAWFESLEDRITRPLPLQVRTDLSMCQMTCLMHAERNIQKFASVSAALVIEPLVQGAAGMLLQPPGFLKRIREICTRNNILMIADEVATGLRQDRNDVRLRPGAGCSPTSWPWQRALPAATCRSPRRTPTRGYLPWISGRAQGAENVLPRPHLHRQPPCLRRGHSEH